MDAENKKFAEQQRQAWQRIPESERIAAARAIQQNQDSAACNYGDQAACARYPGGQAVAVQHFEQMKMRDCESALNDAAMDKSGYYTSGQVHMACH